MRKVITTICICFLSSLAFCQTGNATSDFNFGFETKTSKAKLPDKWFEWGSGYHLKIDTITKRSGTTSILIELIGDKPKESFGCIANSIPAIYEGKEIELRAYMKYKNVTDGPIGLMLRLDGSSDILGFDNMEEKNIQGTSDWKLFSVKLPYTEKAKKIIIGALLTGKGQLWVDDFQVLIDGKDIKDAKLKSLPKVTLDKEFDNGSKIGTVNLTDSKTEDLSVLGKVWGFLKYYHPSIAKGDFNWDYELFRIMPKVLDAKNRNERNKILSAWIIGLGTITPGNEVKIKSETIKLKPDLTWLNKSILGDELAMQLTNIEKAQRSEENYYVDLSSGSGPGFQNEKAYQTVKYPDAGYRMLSLFRYWNIIQYYYPNRHLTKENWNDVLKEFVPQFLNASNELEYKLTALALIGRIHDTHANIMGNDEVLRNFFGKNYVPVVISFIENKAVVTDFNTTDGSNKSGLQIGDVITMIDKKPVEEIIAGKLKYSPASNDVTKLRVAADKLLRTNESTMNIGFIRKGVSETKDIMTCTEDKIVPNKRFYKKDTCFRFIKPDIGYVFLGTLKTAYIPKIMSDVKTTKGLIIDLRCYPAEFVVYSLGKYLVPDSTAFGKFSTGSITSPGLFSFIKNSIVGEKNIDYYKGKVVILVNEVTQSQAEFTTMAFKVAPKTKVIGSTTAGADGTACQLFLPGGILTRISGLGVYYPDGTETQRVGIVPDIIVKPTIKGFNEGRDELIEKAIEIINVN